MYYLRLLRKGEEQIKQAHKAGRLCVTHHRDDRMTDKLVSVMNHVRHRLHETVQALVSTVS